jgi:hypothetical protein
MRRLHTAGLLFVLAAGSALWALAPAGLDAAPKEKMLAPGTLKLAGRTMSCGRTPTLISHTFWDYGGAKKGIIILNPTKLEGLSEAARLYVYAHECGHQLFGPKEIKADCYAVERGKRDGWLNRSGMTEVCAFLAPHPGDWVHPPGIKRCEIMTKCFDKAKPRRAQM